MSKNIISCADGTGNKGGATPNSNVYKIYKAIDKCAKSTTEEHTNLTRQTAFYDNGVGTEESKLIRTICGAIGIGFKKNVCDLYKYLARNYEPGDKVFFFGFSRGASTVRACIGFIHKCGLIKGKDLRNREVDALINKAFCAYKNHRDAPDKAECIKHSNISHGEIDIQFVGIWDTVVALGFPKRTDIIGPISFLLDKAFCSIECIGEHFYPHKFYHYRLSNKVKNTYQALAIDDERTSFWPHVIREQVIEDGNIEQVWFAGMHSNVGGGYGRTGTASISLYWIMLKAKECGLFFNKCELKKAKEDSNPHGRIHNSRGGLATIYRYHPREIESLCECRLKSKIKIHQSAIDRLIDRTANYTPGQLPGEFIVVNDDSSQSSFNLAPKEDTNWWKYRELYENLVIKRKRLYDSMLGTIVLSGALLLSSFFQNSLPSLFSLSLASAFILYSCHKLRKYYLLQCINIGEELRHIIIEKEGLAHESTNSDPK